MDVLKLLVDTKIHRYSQHGHAHSSSSSVNQHKSIVHPTVVQPSAMMQACTTGAEILRCSGFVNMTEMNSESNCIALL